MVYTFDITTPSNTLQISPEISTLKIEKGLITSFFVDFPPGSAGLLHLQIFREYSQIFPKSTGSFRGNDRYFSYRRLSYPILFLPYEVYAHTWNLDEAFSHGLSVHFTVDPPGAII